MRFLISRAGQWVILADHGATARRNMLVGWACVAVLTLVVSVWLPLSRLSFDQAAWPELVHSIAYGAAACIFYAIVAYRLREADDRIGKF